MFKEFITKETAYFNKLHKDGQKLLITIFLQTLIGPLFGIFLNAFLWRQSHDLFLVGLYNIVMYIAVPLGFYLNGYILRRFSPAISYPLSLVVSGLALAALMFLPTISYLAVTLFSLIDGISIGIYWANRNILTLKTTTTTDRIYFSSLETASSTITSVIIPVVIGWFITFGSVIHLYTPIQGYQLLIVYMLIITARIGFISKTMDMTTISVPQLLVKNISRNWKRYRLIQFMYGLENAVAYFVPVLLVLILIGNESALGTVQSIASIVASLLIYLLGKTLHTRHRMTLIVSSIVILIFGSLLFGILYSAIGVFIYFAAQTLAEQFIWVGGTSINYDLIDMDNKDPRQHYAYVCDVEIYLNGGRVVGILLFFLLVVATSQVFALRFSPLIFAGTQFFLLFAYHSIDKSLQKA